MAVSHVASAARDTAAFASLVPAGVAASLLLAACAGLGAPPDWLAAGLAAAGTLVVYNVDRLRGTAADRHSAPARTAFIERHARGLWILTACAGVASLALALAMPGPVQLVCAAILVVGLLHRRLKRWPLAKPLYVALAWVAVTVGIPSLTAPGSDLVLWVVAVHGSAIGANLVATSQRSSPPVPSVLAAARGLAALGILIAVVAPAGVVPLAAIPIAELAALAAFRPDERYSLIILDGALLAGALASLALAWN
jgi:hypothetical protein